VLHCSEHAVASECCRMECHEAQHCSSQALTVSDYRRLCKMSRQQMENVADAWLW